MNYIDGHVVSKNAERLIKNMLMQTIASSQYDKEANADEEKDESDVEEEIPPLKLTDTDLKTILGCSKESDDSEQLGKKSIRSKLAKSMLQREYAKAQQIGERLWQTPPRTNETLTDTNPCAQIADLGKRHLEGRKKKLTQSQECEPSKLHK